jgi:flagellar motility protein MotE (MotC chaperone)
MHRRYLIYIASIIFPLAWLFFPAPCFAGDAGGDLPDRELQLKKREDAVLEKEKRLEVLEKVLEEKIMRYSGILSQLQETLDKLEASRNSNFKRIAKVYEAMQPPEAARKLSSMDEETATMILRAMKAKKAGEVMDLIGSKKAVSFTRRIVHIEKKVPAE